MAVTQYVYDGQNVLQEYDGLGTTQATYTHEPQVYGNLISQHRGSTTSYYHQDALGSTRELTDASETRTDTYVYSGWGESLEQTGTTENPFRWIGNVGYYYDEETADYYVRARYYQPTIGRWISQDPLGFVDGMNLYKAYFVPNMIDPSGFESGLVVPGGFEIGSYPDFGIIDKNKLRPPALENVKPKKCLRGWHRTCRRIGSRIRTVDIVSVKGSGDASRPIWFGLKSDEVIFLNGTFTLQHRIRVEMIKCECVKWVIGAHGPSCSFQRRKHSYWLETYYKESYEHLQISFTGDVYPFGGSDIDWLGIGGKVIDLLLKYNPGGKK